jgi:hypothetical protein
MRGHAHYHLFWCVADRGNFQSLWKGKQWSIWHPLPPHFTIFETSVADFREITSGSPKTRKSRITLALTQQAVTTLARKKAGFIMATNILDEQRLSQRSFLSSFLCVRQEARASDCLEFHFGALFVGVPPC